MTNQPSKKEHWRGPDERDQTDDYLERAESEFNPPRKYIPEDGDGGDSGGLSRRSFLQAAGFTLAGSIMVACSRGPVKKAIPYVIKPEEVNPGEASWYASTCHGCNARCGTLVKQRDGRPIKVEGNPDHPLSKGGLCSVGQATVLELYDSKRLSGPKIKGEGVSWEKMDQVVREKLENADKTIYLLTGTISSPSTRQAIEEFQSVYPEVRHVEYDPVSASAFRAAHDELFDVNAIPRLRFDQAKVILSFDADFLGTWLSPVEYAKGYAKGREVSEESPEMSKHIQVEGRMSLTGTNADERIVLAPVEIKQLLVNLANQIARRKGMQARFGDQPLTLTEERFAELTDLLWESMEESVIITGYNDVLVQKAVAFLNHVLGNYGKTLQIDQPSRQWRGNDDALYKMVSDLYSGEVSGLIVSNVNPAYSLPDSGDYPGVLKELDFLVSCSPLDDETSEQAEYQCPVSHYLESWDDSEPVKGLYSLTQPTISKINNTRTLRESLLAWSGEPVEDPAFMKVYWENEIFPEIAGNTSFQNFWDNALRKGVVENPEAEVQTGGFRYDRLEPLHVDPGGDGFQLVLYQKQGMLDGRHAHNPWLHELPDPVSKVVWDNYVCIAPETADRLNIENGNVVRISGDEHSLTLPALVQQGQHKNVLSVALGYGVEQTRRFHNIGPEWLESRPTVAGGETVGENAYRFTALQDGTLRYVSPVKLDVQNSHHPLALTQTYHTMKVPEELGGQERDLVRETTLETYQEDPAAGNHQGHEMQQLWPNDFVYEGHHWGMAIDLNKCIGCSACVISCQAENNVPVVGKDEVRRRRDMHWIRIDRYYSGEGKDIDAIHQPVMCQHCDHAPCEPVCPVLATVHSKEGINQQIYNRCVGTRYCANNCPFKVRRFNWFEYDHGDELRRMVLNPDVTVRSRGVMEKCSLCIQRIEAVRNKAKQEGREIRDGEIQLACQQSCPTDAIEFGDLNDPDSRIARLTKDPRHYQMLKEMNFRPTVGYMTKVRNQEADGEGKDHA